MFKPEWLQEFGSLIADYNLSKFEFIALFIFVMVMLRVGTILKHRREMAVINADFAIKSTKLDGKLEAQRVKRKAKALKGRG
jgi:hypothetical protein